MKELQGCLFGCKVFCSVLMPGCDELKIQNCSESMIKGKVMERGKGGLLFDVVDKGDFYFSLGKIVKKGHASWSSKIAQLDIPPAGHEVSCKKASMACDDHVELVLGGVKPGGILKNREKSTKALSGKKKKNYWLVLR